MQIKILSIIKNIIKNIILRKKKSQAKNKKILCYIRNQYGFFSDKDKEE